MNMNEYQGLAYRTVNRGLTVAEMNLHALHGLAGEVGEIHSMFQKQYQGHEISTDSLKKEIGDLLWFIAELCTVNEMSMDDVAQANIDKLRKRYPEGFDAERSVHRKEYGDEG